MFAAYRKKVAVALAAAAATSSLVFAGGPASAADSGALSGGCTTLYTPNGGNANVCKTWYSNGDGTYDGTWRIKSKTSGVIVIGLADGTPGELQPSGPYYDVAEFYMAACKSGQCSDWW
ncbi:hypothetical protein [Streptomyces mirabilis]